MRKKIAAMTAVSALALVVPVTSAQAGQAQVGTGTCYVLIDYFTVGADFDTRYPFVHVTGPTGTVGGEVHCPLPPAPSVQDILNSISWT